MTGIYALWFEEPSMVYVGQSQNIQARYKEHLYKLKHNKHTNYKVQDCYNQYGKPELVILEQALIENLNDLEIVWTAEFDSINKGLNIIEAGQVGWGFNSNGSKYSKRQILKVFSLLYRTDMTHTDIARKCQVHTKLVGDIKLGTSHLWLKEIYFDKYQKIRSRQINLNKCIGRHTEFLSPNNEVVSVSNLAEFGRLINPNNPEQFRKGLSKVRAGILKSYLGWELNA